MKLDMKTAIIATVSVIIGGLAYAAITLQYANSRLEEQLQTAMSYQQQLQEQTELNTRQRLEFEARLVELEDDLLETASQVRSLDSALMEAEQRVNPEYEALLEQARLEVAAAASQQRRAPAGVFSVFSNPATTRKMAEDRTAGQFVDYLEGLGISSSEMDGIYAAMVDFNDERYQMLGQLMAGNLTNDQAALIFGPDAMMDRLSDLLTPEQAAELGAYDFGVNQEAARTVYSEMIESSGSAISGESHDLVMDILLDELFSEQNNYGALVASNGSMTRAYEDKLDAFDRARDRLEVDLNADQFAQLDGFIQSQEGTVDLVMETREDGAGNVQVLRYAASAENLPN